MPRIRALFTPASIGRGAAFSPFAPITLLLFATLVAVASCTKTTPARAPGLSGPEASASPSQADGGAPAGRGRATSHDPVVEQIYGQAVADPYRWLEDGDASDVKEWQRSQNERARQFLDQPPGRDALRERTQAVIRAAGDVSVPAFAHLAHGPILYFHAKRSGDLDQPVVYVREGAKGADRVVLDPAKLAPGRVVAIDWWYPSMDGAFVAYGYSNDGTELSSLHVRDVKNGADLPDVIPYTRYASVAWVPDGKGFYYTRFPEPGTVPPGEEQQHRKVFFHRLGNDWPKDKLILEPAAKEDSPEIMISPRGRWLVASVEKGYVKNDVLVRDRSKGDAAKWVPVASGLEAWTEAVPREERLYLVTNDGAPNRRAYVVEYDHPERKLWRELVAEKKDPLVEIDVLRSQIVATYLHEASSRLERMTLAGRSLGALSLPSIGTAHVAGFADSDEAFVAFESFVSPPRVLRFEGAASTGELWDGAGEIPEMNGVETTLTYAQSKDGTKVPLFVVAKKGLSHDGASAALLWGYGGFNSNQTPTFRPYAVVAAEYGVVFASAVLRGGGELGEAWHRAGMLGNKQNVFDDYAACAEELAAEKITSPAKLAAIGRSNGGLLVAAAITQRPELFGAAVAIVPLTDMVRYPRFRIGKWWVTEYGDPEKENEFKWLFAYSPYHHVKDGTRYPATLFSTGESDNRVDPMHSRKMAARLEAAQKDASRPVLLRVDSSAGHGQGKPASKLAEQITDELGFVLGQFAVPM